MNLKKRANIRNKRFRVLLNRYGPELVKAYPHDGQTEVLRAMMRDSDTDTNGISSFGRVAGGLPPDFDATNGATGTSGSRGIIFTTSSFATALNTSGSIRWQTPVADLDTYPSAAKYYMGKTGGQLIKHTSGTGYVQSQFPEDDTDTRIVTDADTRVGVATETFAEMGLYWDASNIYTVHDYLPYDRARGTPDADSTLDEIAAVGLLTGNGTGDGITMRNIVMCTGAPYFTANPDYGKIVFFGDSFFQQGALKSSQGNSWPPYWDPGYGYLAGGTPSTSGLYSSDTGLISAFFRECFRGGLIVGSNNHNDTESGDNTAGCKARAVTWFGSNTADIAVVSIGLNDTSDTSEFDTARIAQIIADYKAIIDACISGGAKRIVCANVISRRNNPTFQTDAIDTNTVIFNNAVISTIEQYDNRVVIADVYTAMGGYTPDTTLFQAGDIHPNSKGQHMFGRTLGRALMNSF